MPNPVSDLTLTQATTGDPVGTLSFDHDGTDLDRFLIGYKRDQDETWTNLEPLPAASFGAGPYETTVPLTSSIEVRAVAVNATNAVSTSNPGAGGPFSIDGVWLSPWRNGLFVENERVHLGAGSPRVVHEVDAEAFVVPGRDEPIFQSSGVVRLPAGTLEGTLMTGHSLNHHQWLARLQSLVENQDDYTRIWMQTPNRFYLNVRFGSWEDAYVVRGDGSFDVSLPFQVMRP